MLKWFGKHLIRGSGYAVLVVVGYSLGALNRPTYEIRSLSFLQGQSEIAVFDDGFYDRSRVGTIEAGPLLAAMQSANWTNASFVGKGSWKLLLPSGERICLSYYGHFFWLPKTPGYFVIQDKDHPETLTYERKISAATIAWRLRNPAAGDVNPQDSLGCNSDA